MSRLTIGAGIAIVVFALAGCASGGSADGASEGADSAPAPISDTDAASPSESNPDAVAAPDACALFDGIDRELLIGTAPGDLVANDNDECSFAASDTGLLAQASITLGAAPALVVLRNSYEGPAYNCEVVDVSGLGDEAFSCFGGNASSHLVFTQADVLAVFSAGSTSSGPPSDSVMLDAAQTISANLTP